MTQPSRVAIDKITVRNNGPLSWIFNAIPLETKLVLDVALLDGEAPIQLLCFCTVSPGNTISPALSFSSMVLDIWPPSPDKDSMVTSTTLIKPTSKSGFTPRNEGRTLPYLVGR